MLLHAHTHTHTHINKFFQSVSTDLRLLEVDSIPSAREVMPQELQTVEKILINVDLNKSPGPDNLPKWIL